MIHLYCLAVQAGFYSDVVECSPVMQAIRVRSPVAALMIRFFSPVTLAVNRNLCGDESKVSIFRNQLRTCECVLDQLTEKVNTDHIDSVVQSFTNFMYDSTANVFSKTVHGRSNKPYGRPKAKNAWFDEKCMEARNNFNRARNLFLKK